MNHGKHEKHGQLLFADETYLIRAAVFEVSRQMGTGFLEAVYQECLAIEFAAQDIPFEASPVLALAYKSRPLKQSYRPDFVCFDRIIVELKASREIAPEHRAQVLDYLKATGLKVGLLVNFGGAPKARVERPVF
jgi:GxxExxY protein